MITSYGNRMGIAESIRGDKREAMAEAIKAWHRGEPLTDEQKALIEEANTLEALNARGMNLG